MINRRVNYVSIAKAIGIVLVVIGHCVKGRVGNFIYLFHMPLFFMITGYLFKDSSVRDLSTYIKRKIKSIYVPFVIWNALFLVFHNLFFYIGFYKDGVLGLHRIDNGYSLLKELLGVLTLTHMEQVTAPTWYLRVLFIATLMYAVICVLFNHNKKIRMVLLGVTYIIPFVFYYAYHGHNSVIIYGILCTIAMFFIEVGRCYKEFETDKIYNNTGIIIAFILLVIMNEFGHINIVSIEFENPIFLFVASLLGLYMVMGISKALDKSSLRIKKYLIFIGDHTMIILVLHCFVFKLVNIIYMITMKDGDAIYQISNATSLFWTVIYVLTGVVVPLLLECGYECSKNILKGAKNVK